MHFPTDTSYNNEESELLVRDEGNLVALQQSQSASLSQHDLDQYNPIVNEGANRPNGDRRNRQDRRHTEQVPQSERVGLRTEESIN